MATMKPAGKFSQLCTSNLRRTRRREVNSETLHPTLLVNGLCAQMPLRPAVSCEGRFHFLHVASQQMRHLIVDHARKRKNRKRGGAQPILLLDEARPAIPLD